MWWQEIVSGFVFMAYLFNTFHGYLFNTYPELKYIKTIVLKKTLMQLLEIESIF